ncbi:MAG: nicotinamide-nucleotide amidohydrolase family protein, partial [Myxococcota bacterium]|nr:nicotinamide-nucleotide amidohydrolase family protein [Myxococcota bacterium]
IRAFFSQFGRTMAKTNEKQAWFPEDAEVLPNPIGTAPGCMLRTDRAVFFCMPGVPRELHRMMDEQVMPRLAMRARPAGGGVVRATLLRTFGMGESTLDDELADLARDDPAVTLGFRTAFPDNYLRPVARGATAEEAEAKLRAICDAIRRRLGPLVYGEGEEATMERVVVEALAGAGRSLAVAESCTGGLLAERITSVSGASRVFLGGIVAYANAAKQALLDVPAELLARHGAVSEAVAVAMAEGARRRLGADLAVSTTGISGPGGGTPEKPVGTVWVGFASEEGATAQEFLFPFERPRHRMVTTQVGLDWVRRTLAGEDRVAPRYLRRPR